MKLRVGIFFGGASREREQSFSAGRAVYFYLNRLLFEPVPIFVTETGALVQLAEHHLLHQGIRDFYPTSPMLGHRASPFRIYAESLGAVNPEVQQAEFSALGTPLQWDELPQLLNLAYLVLPIETTEWLERFRLLRIPYAGHAAQLWPLLVDQKQQTQWLEEHGQRPLRQLLLTYAEWDNRRADKFLQLTAATVGSRMTIRANRLSNAGQQIVFQEAEGVEAFAEAVNLAFGREGFTLGGWREKSPYDRQDHLSLMLQPRQGLGFPVIAEFLGASTTFHHPQDLLDWLDDLAAGAYEDEVLIELQGSLGHTEVVVEEKIAAPAFQCLVLPATNGAEAIAMPPLAVVDPITGNAGAGGSLGPWSESAAEAIMGAAVALFQAAKIELPVLIGGYCQDDQMVRITHLQVQLESLALEATWLMAGEIGLQPGTFLTLQLQLALREQAARYSQEASFRALKDYLEDAISRLGVEEDKKQRIGMVLGGGDLEQSLSLISARTLTAFLAGSSSYAPAPIYLHTPAPGQAQLFLFPASWLFLPSTAAIWARIQKELITPLDARWQQASSLAYQLGVRPVVLRPVELTLDDLPKTIDQVVLTIPGRVLLDTQLMLELAKRKIPFNGPKPNLFQLLLNKYQTAQTLRRNGLNTPEQWLVARNDYQSNPEGVYQKIETRFSYPLILKPNDHEGGFGVKRIRDRQELDAYFRLMYRPTEGDGAMYRRILRLKPLEAFPWQREVLVEAVINPSGSKQIVEVVAPIFSQLDAQGVLHLELWPLAGQVGPGHPGALPLQLSDSPARQKNYLLQVKEDLERAARILQLQGLCTVDAFLQCFEDGSLETTILEINALPVLSLRTPLLQQAALQGYGPGQLMDRWLTFSATQARAGFAEMVAPTEAIEAVPLPSLPRGPVFTPPPVEVTPQPANAPMAGTRNLDLPVTGVTAAFRDWMQATMAFFTSALFLRNLLAFAVVTLILVWMGTTGLKWYTHHGESVQVQDYRGLTFSEAKRKARQSSFRVIIIDSSEYLPGKPPMLVLEQEPKPLARVKENRNIYLTISASRPNQVSLPSMVGSDEYEQYRRKLERIGVFAKIRERKFDQQYEDNTILYFYYQGRRILPEDLQRGVAVTKGTTLQFVVSMRNTERVGIPNLLCLTFEEAEFLLRSSQLAVGAVDGSNGSSGANTWFVWKQEPAYHPDSLIAVGQQVNLFLINKRPAECDPQEEQEQ